AKASASRPRATSLFCALVLRILVEQRVGPFAGLALLRDRVMHALEFLRTGGERGQERGRWVGDDLEHDGTVSREGLVPRRPQLLRAVDEDALQPEELAVGRVAEVGQGLARREARRALVLALLPADLR